MMTCVNKERIDALANWVFITWAVTSKEEPSLRMLLPQAVALLQVFNGEKVDPTCLPLIEGRLLVWLALGLPVFHRLDNSSGVISLLPLNQGHSVAIVIVAKDMETRLRQCNVVTERFVATVPVLLVVRISDT